LPENVQLNLGEATSIPNGFTTYSQLSVVGCREDVANVTTGIVQMKKAIKYLNMAFVSLKNYLKLFTRGGR
jgi:hypothetical protein